MVREQSIGPLGPNMRASGATMSCKAVAFSPSMVRTSFFFSFSFSVLFFFHEPNNNTMALHTRTRTRAHTQCGGPLQTVRLNSRLLRLRKHSPSSSNKPPLPPPLPPSGMGLALCKNRNLKSAAVYSTLVSDDPD